MTETNDPQLDQELRDHFRRTDTEDPVELRRLRRLYPADESGPPPGGRRGPRMRRSLLATLVVVAVAVATAVPLTIALTQRHGAPASGPSPSPSPSITAQPSPLDSLNAYVTSESAREAQAAKFDPSEDTFDDPGVAERSAPVAYNGGYVAVAAFGFDASGHPVQVLSYAGGSWTVVAALGYPSDPGTVVHADSLDLVGSTDDTADIPVGYATGSAPDFLIPLAGSGCARGPVVSDASGAWQYAAFIVEGAPTSDLVGGDPRFDGGTLVSVNNCAASVPQDQRVTSIWTYDSSSGDFTATEQPGWPPSP